MASGLLRVEGSIDLSQFWPVGGADADTTKILVSVGKDAFSFRPHADARFKGTRVFNRAGVRGQGRKPIPAVKDGKITVRLQGVDAPELHYTPQAVVAKKARTKTQDRLYLANNEKFRQLFAETAVLDLVKFLKKGGASKVTCRLESACDEPGEVFDVYGRFVGDVQVKMGNGWRNVNQWLAGNGWAFPTYYASMSEEEIGVLTRLATKARAEKRGAWRGLSNEVTPAAFDPKLIYRPRAKPDPAKDKGRVLLPKMFRRLSEFVLNRKARMVKGKFRAFLATKQSDKVHLTDEFLLQGPSASPAFGLHELLTAAGRFTRGPEEIVFREKPSTLVGRNGKPVKKF